MKLDRFIQAEKPQVAASSAACDMFEVSRAAYYQRKQQIPRPATLADGELVAKIRQVTMSPRGTYGAPRVHQELLAGAWPAGGAGPRLMRAGDWRGAARSGGGRRPSQTLPPRPKRWT